MSGSTPNKAAVAGEVWRLMFDFFIRSSTARTKSLGRRGLTPNDSRALAALDPENGQPMGALADAWECDASNATWVVDRLEKLGLAERRNTPHDRRVKLVLLTAKGARIKAELMEEFYTPPAELLAVDRETLEALRRGLKKLERRTG
jgi:DNA-binding MarR family transcriptional regulator